MTTLGVIFPPSLPPERLHPVARAADEAGLEQLWLWEDCFFESGIAAAGAVLGWTRRLAVGVGLLPVPLRNVALTAMELATLERLFPGRIVPGVGHGVLDWMGQVGARAESPMTLLREYTAALRALLHGESVTTQGRYVQLTDVRLDYPPAAAPPLLVGAQRPRTAEVAGALGDGLILTGSREPVGPRELVAATVRAADQAGRPAPPVVAFHRVADRAGAEQIAALVAEDVADGATHVALHSVGDDAPPLEEFAQLVAGEVRALVPAR